MKKFLFIAAVSALAFFAGSCQRENLEPVAGGTTVTYTVNVPDAIATKADDGVTKLIYEVYRAAEVDYPSKEPIYEGEATLTSGTASLELEFVKNQNFKVLFWAQDPDVTAYDTEDLRVVTLKTSLTANDADLAVFAGSDDVEDCVSKKDGDVSLVRPVSQINIATSPESLKVGTETSYTEVDLKKSSATVKKGLYKVYNVADETVSEASDFEYTSADVPTGTITVGTKEYTYVAMNYVGFAPKAGATVDVDFTIVTSEGDIEHSVSSVPVKPNYKTNLTGNLITASDNYVITLNDTWGTPEEFVEVVSVSTAQELQNVLGNLENQPANTEVNVKLEGNIDLGDLAGLVSTKAGAPTYGLLIPAGKALVLDLNGCIISQIVNQTGNYSMIQNDGNLTILDSKGNGKITYKDSGNGGNYISNTITNRGTLTVKSGSVENNSSEAMAEVGFAYAIDSSIWGEAAETVTNIEGGTVKSVYSPLRVRADSQTENVIANISGGEIYGRIDHQMSSSKPGVKGTLNISGGTFIPYGIKSDAAIMVFGAGLETDASGIVLNVAGGTFQVPITIYRGDYVPLGQGFNEKFITGGTFTYDPSDYVANGYVAKQNENSLWTIVPAPAVVEGGYEISNAAQLKYFAESVNAGETTYNGTTIKLAADIDLQNEPWTPIGFNPNEKAGNEKYYTGTFDGNGHTIKNLYIDVKDQGGVGFFGAIHNATIKNVTFENVFVKAVESEDDPANTSGAEGSSNYIVGGHIGAVAGYDAQDGEITFENVHVKGLVKIEGETRAAQGQRIGGIIGGKKYSNITFNNVSVNGTEGSYIKGYCSTAGVSGQIQGVATYNNVHTDIDVQAVTFGVGGIAGIARHASSFTNCSSAGDLTLDASRTQLSSYSANYPYRVGGIAGCWSESKTGVLELTSCSYTGTLTSIDKDGNSPEAFDYAGYVGRGYNLNGCAGSKVSINGVEYVQVYDKAAESGLYYVNGEYTIASAANLQVFANKVNAGEDYFEGKTVKLANDIDLNNEEWIPIGSITAEHGFMGDFDGNGKTIKNLKMTGLAPDADNYVYAGLFGLTEGTSPTQQNYIKNLVIENVTIATEGHIAAAAIAYPYYTVVENVTVKGNINIKGGNYTSGVLAYTRRCVNAKDLAIEGNTGSSITGNTTVGGVISDIQMNGGLTANYSNFSAEGLTIKAVQNVGGISGIIASQTLDGATVKNVTLVCDDSRTGIVAGALGGISTIKNIVTENVTGATNIVGGTYDNGTEVVRNGDKFTAKN